MQQLTLDDVRAIYGSFDRDFKSVVLSTITEDGFPHASYAPFVKNGEFYYFIISETAKHYENIQNNPIAMLMFLEDELSTSNVFFRKRLTYTVDLSIVDSEEIIELMIETHGELVDMLVRKLDFHIIEARPNEGKLVLGPGRAYFIKDNQIQQDKAGGKGHARK